MKERLLTKKGEFVAGIALEDSVDGGYGTEVTRISVFSPARLNPPIRTSMTPVVVAYLVGLIMGAAITGLMWIS
jgi:hypothetical protein